MAIRIRLGFILFSLVLIKYDIDKAFVSIYLVSPYLDINCHKK